MDSEEKEFTVAAGAPGGQAVAVGSFDRIRVSCYWYHEFKVLSSFITTVKPQNQRTSELCFSLSRIPDEYFCYCLRLKCKKTSSHFEN